MPKRALPLLALLVSIAGLSVVLALADAAGDEASRRAVVPGLSGGAGGGFATSTATSVATPAASATATSPSLPLPAPGQTPTPSPTNTVPGGPGMGPSPTATTQPTNTPTPSPTAPAPTTTASPTPTVATPSTLPVVGGCQVFPADNPWNTDISNALIDSNSAAYIAAITNLGGNQFLHPDFGSYTGYGVPFVVVPANQPLVPITFTAYGDESDPGPYPVPLNAPVEGGAGSNGDRHVLVVRQGECVLYEMYRAFQVGGGWEADSGAVWDLGSNALRPEGWTSADAAGLPILPGLVRWDEAEAGAINHAIRVTFSSTRRAYIHPATHWASNNNNPNLPPMGLRLRLKASYDTSGFTGHARVILEAMKRYGIIVADNGSNWFFTGASDSRWDDDDLNQLKDVPGSAFEVVDTGEPIVTP
jgi:hypothetical protein